MHTHDTSSRTILITLSQGKTATIDEADASLVIPYKWTAMRVFTGLWYAYRKDRGQSILLHRFILDAQPGSRVDHINRDGLDNRRCNLRYATVTENNANRGPQINNTSGYKGVRFEKRRNKWVAQIQVHGKMRHLGYHETSDAAARAYDEAAKQDFGAFAYLNFTEEDA